MPRKRIDRLISKVVTMNGDEKNFYLTPSGDDLVIGVGQESDINDTSTRILTVNSTSGSLSGSFTGSFSGDGTGITGVTAEWDGSHVGNASITGSLYVTQTISGSTLTGSSVEATNITGSVVSASLSMKSPEFHGGKIVSPAGTDAITVEGEGAVILHRGTRASLAYQVVATENASARWTKILEFTNVLQNYEAPEVVAEVTLSPMGYSSGLGIGNTQTFTITARYSRDGTSAAADPDHMFMAAEPLNSKVLDGWDPTANLVLTYNSYDGGAAVWIQNTSKYTWAFTTILCGHDYTDAGGAWEPAGWVIPDDSSWDASFTSLGADIYGSWVDKTFGTIVATGNVGIGTLVPQVPLDISEMGGLVIAQRNVFDASNATNNKALTTSMAKLSDDFSVTFTVPSNGKVSIQISAFFAHAGSPGGTGTARTAQIAIYDGSGYVYDVDGVRLDSQEFWQSEGDNYMQSIEFIVTKDSSNVNLVPGASHTFNAHFKASATSAIYIYYGANYLPFIMKAVTVPNTIL